MGGRGWGSALLGRAVLAVGPRKRCRVKLGSGMAAGALTGGLAGYGTAGQLGNLSRQARPGALPAFPSLSSGLVWLSIRHGA